MKTDKFDAKWGPEGTMFSDRYGRQNTAFVTKVYTEGVQVINDLTNGETFPVESFFDMDKNAMIEHMVEVHDLHECARKAMSVTSGTKATKEELIAAHNRAHAALENPMSEFDIRFRGQHWVSMADNDNIRFEVGGTPVPTLIHSHMVPALSTAGAAVRDNKPAGDKPLSAAEANVLKELVNNDFSGLKAEMSAFASDALAQSQAEINAEWSEKEKSIPDYADQATKIKRKHDTKVKHLREKFEADNMALAQEYEDKSKEITEAAAKESVVLKEDKEEYVREDGKKTYRPIFRATVQGRKEALENAAQENKKFLDRALMTLEGQRLAAQRRVLVSRVNPQGAAILDGIPDAKRMMVEASQTATREPIGVLVNTNRDVIDVEPDDDDDY